MFRCYISAVALKRMLNFNAPPLKNTAAEPVWKVSHCDSTPTLMVSKETQAELLGVILTVRNAQYVQKSLSAKYYLALTLKIDILLLKKR